jgi:sulfide:quinone oxidoreductase
VIAGGGLAGLETLFALRALAPDRVALTLVAPDDEFVYRPVAVGKPFAGGRNPKVLLSRAARDGRATFVAATIESVDPERKIATSSEGDRLEYDALVVAVGAEAMPAVANVVTWDDRSESEVLGGLLRDIEQGSTRLVAVLIPPGPGWALRGYELALLVKREADGMRVEIEMTIVTPEPPSLAKLGERAVELVSNELKRAGVAVASAAYVDVVRDQKVAVVLLPSRNRLEVDRVLALPILRGRPIPGIPADRDGFVEIDDHCRVRGLEDTWAAGDCTALAVKSGRFAAEQADVAAEDVAAAAGAAIEVRRFDPVLGEDVAARPPGRFLEAWLGASDDLKIMHLPSTGVPVLTYVQRDLAAGWRGYG